MRGYLSTLVPGRNANPRGGNPMIAMTAWKQCQNAPRMRPNPDDELTRIWFFWIDVGQSRSRGASQGNQHGHNNEKRKIKRVPSRWA